MHSACALVTSPDPEDPHSRVSTDSRTCARCGCLKGAPPKWSSPKRWGKHWLVSFGFLWFSLEAPKAMGAPTGTPMRRPWGGQDSPGRGTRAAHGKRPVPQLAEPQEAARCNRPTKKKWADRCVFHLDYWLQYKIRVVVLFSRWFQQ